MRIVFLILLFITIESTAQSIDEKIKQRVEYGETPGIVVGIYENGKTQYYAYGVANVNTKEPVTSKTLFEIGSITKTFTTSMAAILSLEQKLNFADPAQKYLPAKMVLPERNGKAITLEHLATAHSGLPRMPLNFQPKDPSNPYIDYSEEELTYFISNYELTRDPGSEYEYSNLGMGLLGYIVTRVNEKTYSNSLEQLITKPLKMNQTYINGQRTEKSIASGYADNLPMKAWTWDDQSVITGAGGIVSNAEDMMKYMIAQINSNPLSKPFALTHQPRADAGKMKIGYGWHIRDENIVWHNGGTGGFRSFAGFDKTKNKAIVILTNSTTGADDLGFHLLNDQYALKELKKPVKVDETLLKEYAGVYEIAPTFSITVTYENEGLSIQATGQPKINIYAESETKFYLKVVDAQIEFKRNDSLIVDQLILYQNGAAMPGKKVK
ncbi:MAG: serine hydrolase [Cyclobacteriaceae bacterium]|nr:serine hydrolase [Cyclobacteriaceae bacterium]